MKRADMSTVCRDRVGFTLVELLVVIGIIGLLAAMMFPMINSARASSKRSVCANNMRQWGAAMQAYADVHNGKMPGHGAARGAATVDELGAWYNVLPPMVGMASLASLKADGKLPRPGDGRPGIFLCPSCLGADLTSLGDDDYFGSYAINGWVESKRRGGDSTIGDNLLFHQIEHPSIFVLFAGNPLGIVGGLPGYKRAYTDPIMMATATDGDSFRHGKRTNICFADGHVSGYKKAEVYVKGMTDEDNFGGIQWNPDNDKLDGPVEDEAEDE